MGEPQLLSDATACIAGTTRAGISNLTSGRGRGINQPDPVLHSLQAHPFIYWRDLQPTLLASKVVVIKRNPLWPLEAEPVTKIRG